MLVERCMYWINTGTRCMKAEQAYSTCGDTLVFCENHGQKVIHGLTIVQARNLNVVKL